MILMVAVLAGSLLACSPKSTALTGTRHLEQNRTGDIQKVLVVGISPNGPVRNRFEQEVKKQLGKHKIDAVGSLEVLPKEEAINKEAFVKYFSFFYIGYKQEPLDFLPALHAHNKHPFSGNNIHIIISANI